MVRFLHTSDWHLGKSIYEKSLLEDQEAILEQLLALIDRVRPHALLIAGDVFDRPIPPEAAVRLFDRFLHRAVTERKLPVFLIPGNHDSCERLGFASRLLRDRGVTIFSRIEDAFYPVRVRGDGGHEVDVFGIPFVEPIQIGQALGDLSLDTPDTALRSLCRAMLERSSERPGVLLAHAFVAGGETSESEKDIFIGGSSLVAASAFDGFAYTALGHLHKPQRAGSHRVRYCGSLLPYSKSEADHRKAVLEVHVDHLGGVEAHEHELPRLRSLRYVEATLESLLLEAARDPQPNDYIIAGYTDTGAVADPKAKLQRYYPNLLSVARAGAFLPEESPALARARENEDLSELELFGRFFEAATGQTMSEAERDVLVEALRDLEKSERTA